VIGDAVSRRLARLIARYGQTIGFLQAGTGVTISAVPALVRLSAPGDHTTWYSATEYDTWARPAWDITLAGACPQFGGTVAPVAGVDYVVLTPPGGVSASYTIRVILQGDLPGGVAVRTQILVSK
jgi:hypothetical protein